MPNRRQLLAAAAAAPFAGLARPALAQGLAKMRFTLDWARQGPNAYADMGREKGFFRDAGLDVSIDRGFGSGRVPVDIAAGAYDMGQADISPVLKFMAENPSADLVVVGIWGERSLLCVTVRADGPIRTPKDLEGKTLAAPESDAGRQLFPAFAKAAGLDASTVKWMTVTSDLREVMLVQKRAEGITGAVASTSMSLKALGLDVPQQRVMYYRDSGVELLGYCFLTTRRYLQSNPEAVRGALKALYRSLAYANRNRAESIAALKRVEPLTDVAIETERQAIAFDQGMLSDHVAQNGLSAIDPARFGRVLRTVEEAYNLPPRLTVERVYDPAYLPPVGDRRV